MSPRADGARGRRPKTRMVRLSVGLDAHTHEELRKRSRAHKVSKAAYVRAAITGARPGGQPGQPAAAADTWWDNLSPERRASLHLWLTQARKPSGEIDPDQLDILTLLVDLQEDPDAA